MAAGRPGAFGVKPLAAVSIRRARPADAHGLAAVHVRPWQATSRDLLPADFLAGLSVADRAERWRTRLRDEPAGTVVAEPVGTVVAEVGGEIVGFASVGPSRDADLSAAEWLELNTLYLLPETWGTGLAGRLLAAALTAQRRYFLWVFEGNARARAFYRKAGFVPDGTSKQLTIAGTTLTEIRFRGF